MLLLPYMVTPVIVRAGAALCHQAGHHTASKDQRYLVTSTIIRYILGCFGLQPYTLGIAAPCTVTRVTISQDIQQARVGVGGQTRYTWWMSILGQNMQQPRHIAHAAHWADCRDQSQSSSPFTVPRFRGTIEMSGDVWTCQHQEEMVATFPAGGVSMFPTTD